MGRKWSPRSKLCFGLAVVCGLAAFSLVHGYVQRVAALQPGEPANVIVAVRDIPRGAVIEPGSVRSQEIPQAFVPPGAVVSVDRAAGKSLLAPISAGEILTSSRLGPGAGAVAGLVPPGLRAVALPTSLPPGAVSPGDRVDVLATYPGSQSYTETAISSAEVLDVLSPERGELGQGSAGPVLVLLTDPEGAARLARAVESAKTDVAILGPEDATLAPQSPGAVPSPFASAAG